MEPHEISESVVATGHEPVKPHSDEGGPRAAFHAFTSQGTDALRATICGNQAALDRMAQEFRHAASRHRVGLKLALDPWTDPAVAYGAQLAIAHMAELASRMIIPPEVLRHVVSSSEARRVLMSLATKPGGSLPQARLTRATGIHRANAQSTLKKLEDMKLLTFAKDGEGAKILELTSQGWAAAELVRAWGLDRAIEEAITVEKLLQVGMPQKDWAELVADNPVGVGCGLGNLIRERKKTYQKQIAGVMTRGIRGLEPEKLANFVLGTVEGATGRTIVLRLRRKASDMTNDGARISVFTEECKVAWGKPYEPLVKELWTRLTKDEKATSYLVGP